LSSLQRHDDALEAFDRAIALRPDDAEPLGNKGTLLTLMGRGAEARAALARAAALAPVALEHRLRAAVAWLPLVRDAADDRVGGPRALRGRGAGAARRGRMAAPVRRPEEVVGAAQPFYLAYQASQQRGPAVGLRRAVRPADGAVGAGAALRGRCAGRRTGCSVF
jgi:tetratricopeptide (TPR) repeat protein